MSVSGGVASEGVAWMPRGWRPSRALQIAILDLLRDRVPAIGFSGTEIQGALARYQCGGWIRGRWATAGRLDALPTEWRAALDRAERKIRVDNLAALAEFRRLGGLMRREEIPLVLLKGADYLLDLYEDPAARFLTDIDLLVKPGHVGPLARVLRDEGYVADLGYHYPEHRRFEMWRPAAGHCRFEFHWQLGLRPRVRIDQDALWERSRSCTLEDVECRRLDVEDALLFHCYHMADTYFGPALKWVIDLRLMFERRRPDPARLIERSTRWRMRTALHLALEHVERIFPGTVPAKLNEALRPGALRRALLNHRILDEPLELLDEDQMSFSRYPLRLLLMDGTLDALALSCIVLSRPIVRPMQRILGAAKPPWER